MDLRAFLHHFWVKASGFAQGNELAVIAGAQGFGCEHEVFAGEIPQVDLPGLCFWMMRGQRHYYFFIEQQARFDVFRRNGQPAHEGDICLCGQNRFGLAGGGHFLDD